MNDLVSDPPRMAALKDLLEALAMLGALPRRALTDVRIEEAVFTLALKDERGGRVVVAADDLRIATQRIISGALGHGFHPSPPELRRVCDQVKDERVTEYSRRMREQRMMREMEERRSSRQQRTPEERERVRLRTEEAMRSLDASSIDPRMRSRDR
ncbi:hypothetical protein [Ancylobacter sp. FA202]|uniref:hypothetical protein n=1 Tax=Ancylobacter sp. FA202 TaxID=1111106 RepID=UPI001FD8CFA9|nr:hypothetical protein [Ancylobacter sp. FA202]